MACVALYGYALAGYGAYSFGKGRADYIVGGLASGTLCGAAALLLWKKWTRDETPDMLIFDVDGVLIDTRDSFVYTTAETVRWCWKNLLCPDGAADCEGYTLEYFNLCKKYSAFNDDAVVTWTLLRYMKRRMDETGSRSMKEVFPSLEAWEEELKAFDPGEIARDANALSWAALRPIFGEIYFGAKAYAELCGKAKYGAAGEGFWAMEKPGTIRSWKDLVLPVGVYTGRSREEMALALKHLNWTDFPSDMLVTSDDEISKPSPLGLSILCERAGARTPLFFGDTTSDKEAWRAFGRGIFVAIGPILKAESRREGAPHFDTLEKALEELV
jgi:phosphoglycolate phosphatase-like HAD superfamily hydrolase